MDPDPDRVGITTTYLGLNLSHRLRVEIEIRTERSIKTIGSQGLLNQVLVSGYSASICLKALP